MERTPLQLAQDIVKILDNKKGSKIEVIKVDEVSTLTEYFVICTGTSTTQVKALADEVEFKLKHDEKDPCPPLRTEGYQSGNWIVLDYGSVILHVFHTEMRAFYDLEHLWADGETVAIDTLITKEEAE